MATKTKTAAKKTNGNTGNRYSDKQKMDVVKFVENAGRGGISEAQKKFGVSYIAVRSWMKKLGKDAAPSEAKVSKSQPTIPENTPKGFKKLYKEIQDEMTRTRNDFNTNMTRLEEKMREIFA